MSKYIKLEDAIEAYNQAVTLLVESEMEEFNLGDFTECSFNTTQIKLIARMIENLPTTEVSEDCISREWVLNKLTEYVKDYELNELDSWQNTVVEWIATDIEDAPSVVPTVRKNRQVGRAEGEWIKDDNETYICSACGSGYKDQPTCVGKPMFAYCPNCGAKMKG